MTNPSESVRRERYERFGGLCAYCRNAPADHLDHVWPKRAGGPDSMANRLPACRMCGESKGSDTVRDWVERRARELAWDLLWRLAHPEAAAAAPLPRSA